MEEIKSDAAPTRRQYSFSDSFFIVVKKFLKSKISSKWQYFDEQVYLRHI